MTASTPSPGSHPPETFTALGAERFVSLTTFRRNGNPVATTVWIASLGEDLIVTTPAVSGKLKRLRNNAQVLLTRASRFGSVAADASVVHGLAEILGHDRDHPREKAAVRSKYGLEYRVVVAFEALTRRLHRQSTQRIILRIRHDTIA